MRLTLTVAFPALKQRADAVVEADASALVGDLVPELAALAGTAPPPPALLAAAGHRTISSPLPGSTRNVLQFPGSRLFNAGRHASGASLTAFVDGQPVDARLPLSQSPIREGCVVSLGDPAGCMPPEPAGIVEIRVASGPAAGTVHRLTLGDAIIGKGPAAHIRVADPAMPDDAVMITVDTRGEVEITPHAGVRVLLDRAELAGPACWPAGAQLAVGSSLLELAPYGPPDAALAPSEDGAGFDFNRPPRLLPPPRQTHFRLPSPPGKPERRPLPILMAVIPAVMGIGLWVATKSLTMLLFVGLTPMMMVGQYFSDRRQGGKSHARQTAEYTEAKARIERDASEALETERTQLRAECPDPAAVLTIASGPRRRLWERRRSDPDYLLLRVGTADLPSAVVLEDPTRDEHRREVTWQINDAPVAIPLPERGVLGVAGPPEVSRAVGRWLVAQAATLHSPNDLRICLLTDAGGQKAWDWVRWLPHARPAEEQDANVLIGNDAETVAARVAELTALVAARQKVADGAGRQVRFAQADTLLVLDGSRRLRSMPGVIQLLRDGPAVGVWAVCLDTEERLLPAECHAVVAAEPGGLRVQQMSGQTFRDVRPDQVSVGWCARLARSIAPIRDVSDDEEAAGLPESSRLLDVLQLEPPGPEAIAARWRAGGQTTIAIAGESFDGPFGIDLRRDGPHGLIAGTTGSGKSELLQTIVASLAVANRPDAMTFVLVDYKGGSAFADCVRLPHTVGMVTDLDAHLVERALESLSAELTRREHILARAGAKDIEDYLDLAHRDRGAEPMPRLLIIIDEFASMVRDLPDFVTGLVNIAQRGRSLGIHLILATQRPSGVVSADIRANTNLRIALRVTDPAESTDVIDAPDAARISKSTPGRAYARLGASSLVPFQAGRIGGRRPGTGGGGGESAGHPWLARLDWVQLGRQVLQPPPSAKRAKEEITDLKVLVGAISQASERLGIPRQHSPWLDPLPTDCRLSALAERHALAEPAAAGERLPAIGYALDDLPAQQEQRVAVIELASFGHMLAAGAPRSGRSQLLRTIAGSVATTVSCADVHLYGIDCGNGALLALTSLPHCGAVVSRTQPERATRLMRRLVTEVSRRQELLASGGFADITEQRAAVPPPERLPHLLVMLDRWEGFLTSLGELAGGELIDQVYKLLSEGASAGVHLVVTGDHRVISGRLGQMTENKISFRLADKSDFSAIGVHPRKVPDEMPPGRAVRAETAVETQVALLGPDATGQGQATALSDIGQEAAHRDAGVPRERRPFRVDVLPASISFAGAWKLRGATAEGSPLFGMAGVGGDELTAYGPDMSQGVAAFVVAGPNRSGRSTALMCMARSFLTSGAQVVLVTPRPSPLRTLAGEPGVVRSFESTELGSEEFATALAEFTGPGVVLMDDAELLIDCDASDELSKIMSFGADRGQALVLAGNASDICAGFGNWQNDAKKARRGCLLSPQDITDADLIGIRVPRDLIGGPVTPGRGLLHLGDGTLRIVQVPQP